MKLGCLVLLSSASAFTLQSTTASKRDSRVTLEAVSSRRNLLTSAAITSSLIVGLGSLGSSPANADIDYSKVQDLLGRPDDDSTGAPRTYTASGRPTYLTEPTDDFKKNEAKASEFRKREIQRKKAFLDMLDKLETDPNDQDLLAKDLDALRGSVRTYGGLPLGITKDELVKRIRRRKAKRFWPVQVEIAYQDLLQELRAQQSPDYKDEENPL